MQGSRLMFKIGIVLVAALLMPLASVLAADITVDDTVSPGTSGDSKCSFFEAMENATGRYSKSGNSSGYSNDYHSDCTAGTSTGTDTVILNANVTLSGTHRFNSTRGDLTITGNGSSISGDFSLDVRNGTATINQLTIRDSGTAVLIGTAGTLNFNNGSIVNNTGIGGVIQVRGRYARVNIVRSSITGNQGRRNWGSTKNGVITVSGSSSYLHIHNSTISGNSTNKGASAINGGGGTVKLQHVTINNNSGGATALYSTGSRYEVQNTIVANNGGKDCKGWSLAVNSGNLMENSGCGTPQLTSDPQLGALANGYHIPQTGSPVIDAAPDCAGMDSGTDQAGRTRKQNGTCDIGAYETTGSSGPPDL